jgi:hypothetical protein
VSIQAEPHEIADAQDDIPVEDALLRDIPDQTAALARRTAVDAHHPGRRLEQPEQDSQQRRLARPVRSQDGSSLPRSSSKPSPSKSMRLPKRSESPCAVTTLIVRAPPPDAS